MSVGTRKNSSLNLASLLVVLLLNAQILHVAGYLKSVRIEEIPFGLTETQRERNLVTANRETNGNIHAKTQLETRKNFIHLFHIPYIVCFFAAKGKWPFIPGFMQYRVDTAARTLFSHNDSYVKQFCQKWIAIKECFRPIFGPTTPIPELELDRLRTTSCPCAADSVVVFDKDHIGSVSQDTIYNTIEFLESFLPRAPPTRKTIKYNRVRGRLDEIDID